jgi:hypothetical protein
MLSTHRSPPPRRRSGSLLRTAFAALLLSTGCTEVGTNAAPESPPDYAIEAKYTTDGSLDDLSTVSLQVGVRNLGGRAPDVSFVSMYVDDVFIRGVALGTLAPGGKAMLAFDWDAEPGAHAIRFEIRQVAPDAESGAEADVANNVVTLPLTVPTRERRIIAQAWRSSAELLSPMRGDAPVQKVLALAKDSGFTIASSASTLATRYDGEGVTTLITPMGPPNAPANSAPLLVVIQYPTQGHGTVQIPYLFRLIDRTTYVVYNAEGGSRVSLRGAETQVSEFSSAVSGSRGNAATGNCQEDTSICDQARDQKALCDRLHAQITDDTTLYELSVILAHCDLALELLEKCANALVDNPPTISTSLGTNGTTECAHCLGKTTTLLKWKYYGWLASASDDRGSPTWNSSDLFEATCNGGSYTFSVTDCGGQTASVVVNAVKADLPSVPNWEGCEDQGDGKNKSALLLFPGSSAPLLSARSPWRNCNRLPSRFEDDPSGEHVI